MDALTFTLIFAIAAGLTAAFFRRVSRDKCLKDFEDFPINIELVNKKEIWGELEVFSTGLELWFTEKKSDGLPKNSFMIYKSEYPQIQLIVRYHDKLSDEQRKRREKELKAAYHPNFFRRARRKTANFFKSIRDSVSEVLNIFISHMKKVTPAGNILTQQDRYINQMRSEFVGSMGAAYEPLLENHIGKHVILELLKENEIVEYRGILKDYTSEFIELMDVKYPTHLEGIISDIIVSRKFGLVRHLSE